MEEKGIHYRIGGNLTHCGCECLPNGQDIEYIIIEKIEFCEDAKVNGQKKNNVWIATFAKNPYTNLPMVLNATNRKRIAKLYPNCNGYINLLKNIPVRLTKELTRDAVDGGQTWGLRISKEPAKEPQAKKIPLTKEDTAKWTSAVSFLKGGNSIDKIKAKYIITPELEEELLKDANNG